MVCRFRCAVTGLDSFNHNVITILTTVYETMNDLRYRVLLLKSLAHLVVVWCTEKGHCVPDEVMFRGITTL